MTWLYFLIFIFVVAILPPLGPIGVIAGIFYLAIYLPFINPIVQTNKYKKSYIGKYRYKSVLGEHWSYVYIEKEKYLENREFYDKLDVEEIVNISQLQDIKHPFNTWK